MEKEKKLGSMGVEQFLIKNGRSERQQYSRERESEVAKGLGERGDSCKTEINYGTEWHSPEGHETHFLALFLAWTEGRR